MRKNYERRSRKTIITFVSNLQQFFSINQNSTVSKPNLVLRLDQEINTHVKLNSVKQSEYLKCETNNSHHKFL